MKCALCLATEAEPRDAGTIVNGIAVCVVQRYPDDDPGDYGEHWEIAWSSLPPGPLRDAMVGL